MQNKLNNINIAEVKGLITPDDFKNQLPVSAEHQEQIYQYRKEVKDILDGKDRRLLAITGPCSIHNADSALEYASKLAVLKKKFKDRLMVIMRVYFEKPRTSVGWRGLITDPDLNGTYNIEEGLFKARKLLLNITERGLPTGTEILDPIIPQYISELITWAAIGARTTESQTHRELTSGLSMPVGFKNGTDGSVIKAINAIQSAAHPHSFIGIDQQGLTSIFSTKGNRTGHIILRGGANGPNYYEEHIEKAEALQVENGLRPAVIVDCSHANSSKRCELQERVLSTILHQRKRGQTVIRGFMLESNLVAGKQPIPKDLKNLVYGQSITDECIGWDETEDLLQRAYEEMEE